jgi:glycosyltransferase involved in cell wall biosynthesis
MRILVTGNLSYHQESAAKFRVLEVVRALEALGHQVVVFDALSPAPATPYGDGAPVAYVRKQPARGALQRVAEKIGIGFSLLLQPWGQERFDAVYCYGSELSWLLATWRFARRQQARLIVDVTELYGFEEMFGSFAAFRARIGGWIGLFPGIPLLADGIAVPSSRFHRFFRRFRGAVQLLPPFFSDLGAARSDPPETEVLALSYAGSPSNKEWLSLIFRALDGMPVSDSRRIRFDLVGLSNADVDAVVRGSGAETLLGRADLQIEARGRTSPQAARAVVRASDFSIVIRRRSVRVNFGFPSKVAEAFRLGTPVISNAYSDMTDYLRDGVNGLALRAETAEALGEVLERARAMGAAERAAMRQAAGETGLRFFSRERASGTLKLLLEGPGCREESGAARESL